MNMYFFISIFKMFITYMVVIRGFSIWHILYYFLKFFNNHIVINLNIATINIDLVNVNRIIRYRIKQRLIMMKPHISDIVSTTGTSNVTRVR